MVGRSSRPYGVGARLSTSRRRRPGRPFEQEPNRDYCLCPVDKQSPVGGGSRERLFVRKRDGPPKRFRRQRLPDHRSRQNPFDRAGGKTVIPPTEPRSDRYRHHPGPLETSGRSVVDRAFCIDSEHFAL